MSWTLRIISTSSIFILMVCKFVRCPLGPGVTLNALPDYAASLLHFLSNFCNTQCSLYNALFSSRPKSKSLACDDRFVLNLGRWQSSSLKLMISNPAVVSALLPPFFIRTAASSFCSAENICTVDSTWPEFSEIVTSFTCTG